MVSGTADTFAIGDNTLAGNFTFTQSGSDLALGITNLTASLGGGLVKIGGQAASSGATANLTVSSGQVSGSFSGYLQAGTATGVSFSGGLSVAITPTSITATGTNDTLTIGGQQISGNFTFAEDTTTHALEVTVSGVSFSLGGVLSVTNVNGTIDIGSTGLTGNVSGTVSQSLAGLSGTFGVQFAPGVLEISATGASLTLGGQTLSGDFDFVQNSMGLHLSSTNFSADLGGGLVTISNGTGNLTVSNGHVMGGFSGQVSAGGSMTGGVGFAGTVSVTVSPGGISATGTGDVLTIGSYSLATDFTFVKDTNGLELTIDNLNFSLGSAISITNAAGMLSVTSSGVSGYAAGTVSSSFSGVSIMGQLGVTFGSGTVTVSGKNDSIVARGQSVSGDFSFTQGSTGTQLTASNFAASFGGGLVTVSQGSGTLNVGAGQITGSFSGTISAGSVGGGVSFTGPISVAVTAAGISASTPAGDVDTLTVAGQTVSAGFSFTQDSNGLELTLSNLSVSLGGVVSLTDGSGMLLVNASGVSGAVAGTLSSSFPGFSFNGNLSAMFSPGVLELSGTGDTLTAADQTVSGDFNFVSDNTGLHLEASNFSASFGGGLVGISNASGSLDIVDGALTGGFTGNVSVGSGVTGVSFAGAITVNVSSDGITASTPTGQTDTITVLGQSLSAAFNFSEDASGLELGLSGVNLSFGNGAIAVTNAAGTVLVSKSGVSGSIEGGLSANVPGVSFNSTNFDIAFGPTSLAISGMGVSLTAYNRQISGNFTFAKSGNNVSLHVDNLGLSVGGIVSVTAGRGRLHARAGNRRGDERVGIGQCVDHRSSGHPVRRKLQRFGRQRRGQRQRNGRYPLALRPIAQRQLQLHQDTEQRRPAHQQPESVAGRRGGFREWRGRRFQHRLGRYHRVGQRNGRHHHRRVLALGSGHLHADGHRVLSQRHWIEPGHRRAQRRRRPHFHERFGHRPSRPGREQPDAGPWRWLAGGRFHPHPVGAAVGIERCPDRQRLVRRC